MEGFAVVWHDIPYLLWGAFPQGPLGGLVLTLLLSAGSAIAAAALGLTLGIGLTMSHGALRAVLISVMAFFRAIPVLMLIFWTYFLLPFALGINVPGVLSVMCALSLVGGAYLGHSVNAGLQAVAKGQWEAGHALGLSRWQTLRHIVLPQALQMMLPSFINQWVTLIKDSSLAYIVGVNELSFVAAQINGRLIIYPAEIFMVVGLMYWTLCASFDALANRLARYYSAEARLARYRTSKAKTVATQFSAETSDIAINHLGIRL